MKLNTTKIAHNIVSHVKEFNAPCFFGGISDIMDHTFRIYNVSNSDQDEIRYEVRKIMDQEWNQSVPDRIEV